MFGVDTCPTKLKMRKETVNTTKLKERYVFARFNNKRFGIRLCAQLVYHKIIYIHNLIHARVLIIVLQLFLLSFLTFITIVEK